MASKAKKIARTAPTQPETAVGIREGLLDSTREHGIRIRAYEIYLQRGGQPGDALDDWLQAERELTSLIQFAFACFALSLKKVKFEMVLLRLSKGNAK